MLTVVLQGFWKKFSAWRGTAREREYTNQDVLNRKQETLLSVSDARSRIKSARTNTSGV